MLIPLVIDAAADRVKSTTAMMLLRDAGLQSAIPSRRSRRLRPGHGWPPSLPRPARHARLHSLNPTEAGADERPSRHYI